MDSKTLSTIIEVLIQTSPTIRDFIKSKTSKNNSSNSNFANNDFEKRIQSLEKNETTQFEFNAKLAEQNQNIAEALRLLSAKLNYIMFVSIFALLFSIMALVLSIF